MREEASRVRIMDGTFSGVDQRAGALFPILWHERD
jgi:hypothetical protein